MDVRCSRCGVEYEFDDEKVSPAGVTVKCTSCGHVFKVKRSSPEESAPFMSAPSGEGWMVRNSDGTVMRFKELTTLQKWIVEQKVGSHDEISRTGRSWRPLGEIAELASFFEVVEAANAARKAQAAQPSPPSSSAAKVGGSTQLMPTPPQVALSDLSSPSAPSPSTPSPSTPSPPTATASLPSSIPRSPLAPPRGATSDVHTPPPTELKRAPTVVPAPPAAEVGFYASGVDELDDEDPVAAWGKRARRRNAALVVVGLLVLASAALFFLARPTFDRLVASGAALFGVEQKTSADGAASEDLMARVDASLRERGGGDAALLDELTQAAGNDDVPALTLAALSRLHAAAALRAFDEQKLLEAKPGADDVTSALVDVKKRGADHLAEAYSLAGRARSAAPELADADLAFAAYQAAKGAALEASADIESARRHGAGDARVAHETAVLSSLAAAAAASDDEGRSTAKALIVKARQGLEQDARLDQATLVLSALSSGSEEERAATRAAAEAWQKDSPGDARPALVLALLGAEATGASDEGTNSAGGNESAGNDAEPGSAKPDGAAADDDEGQVAAEKRPSSDDAASAKGEGPDYDTLMKRAEQSRIRERTSAALSLYKKAVNLRPRAAKPHVGMGWCYLDLDKTRAARDAFAHAIDLDSGLAEAHFGLAEAQRYSGQKTAALRSYKRYLELAPSGPDAAVARNAIQNLE